QSEEHSRGNARDCERTERQRPRYHGGIAGAARRRPENSQRCAGKRVWEKRRHCRGDARGAPFKTIASDTAFRARKNRAGFNEACAARTLDRLESLAHLARTPALLCAKAGLQSVRNFSALPERHNF